MYEQEIGDLCSSLLSQHSSRKGERREGLLLYIATRPHTHTHPHPQDFDKCDLFVWASQMSKGALVEDLIVCVLHEPQL